MKKTLYFVFFLGISFSIFSQNENTENIVANLDSTLYQNRAPVLLENEPLFYLYENLNGISPYERAALINQRLSDILTNPVYSPDSFRVVENDVQTQLFYGRKFLANITEADAAWHGKSPGQTAEDYLLDIKSRFSTLRAGRDLRRILIEIGLALLVVAISVFTIKYVNRFFRFLAVRLGKVDQRFGGGLKIGTYQMMDGQRLKSLLLVILNALRLVVLFVLFFITLPILLNIFPATEGIAETLFDFILNPLKSIIKSIVDFLPNLFTILVIFFVVRYLAKGVWFLATEIREDKLKINGFYPDWAVPTARIFIFLLYVFMLVLIWPYLPGSGSPVFQGVSVFLGLLISLGSSSAISNIMAGLVITYMRPFKVGDRVRIGETSGDVVAKNLLVTRVRTIKNELITVPNSVVMSQSSVNFSDSGDLKQGLILHTSVTIGYDVPWRKIHKMLEEAAQKTPLIGQIPAPFVLQKSLDDFYVNYELNAYTREPTKQAKIYSDLHQNIQDVFAENEVEIMSPHYRAEREGPSTIPHKKSDH